MCTKIHAQHWFLCKNNLNLPRWFFLPCASLPPLVHCVVMLATSLHWFLFVCFYRSWFSSPIIKQIYLGQFKCWFAVMLPGRRENYHGTGPLCLHINYTNMISELYQHMYSYNNISFVAELKQALRMILSCITSCESHELLKLTTGLSICHNWELLIVHPNRPLCFKKIRTNTRSHLIFNTVVPNPDSHSIGFDPQIFCTLILSSKYV